MRAAATKSRNTAAAVVSAAELRLQCPQCSAALGSLREDDFPAEFLLSCTTCRFQILNEDGIWRALPPVRADYFKRFIREYQVVREAEGRGSANPDYYFALPYEDLSGHNQEQWAIRSRTYRFLEHTILPKLEASRPCGMGILDLGAGNGWMSYRMALRGHRPAAVDLATSEGDGLAAANHYRQKLPRLFPRFQAELDRLPFADHQFDLAIFNASFHYSENYAETLGEAIRCVRPGGSVIIADTAWYSREESGREMLAERQKAFVAQYGFPSDGLSSLEYLTDRRLAELEREFRIRWLTYVPFYGLHWAMRPLVAKLKGKREPSRFRIYVAEVAR
jgi:SAM-dependent methyltransferase